MNAKEILAKLAKIDEMEAEDGMNIVEDLLNDNEKTTKDQFTLAPTSHAIDEEKLKDGQTKKPTEEDLDDIYDAINTLNKSEYFIETKKELEILIKAQDILSKLLEEGKRAEEQMEESINETKKLAADKVEYLFDVQITMDAENEVPNNFLKSDIQKAIEDRLEKYDVEVSVQNA